MAESPRQAPATGLGRDTQSTLATTLGLPNLQATGAPIRLLRDATLAAAGLIDSTPLSARAREAIAAAVHVCGRQLAAWQLAKIFGVSCKTINRYRAKSPDRQLIHAIKGQLHLRSREKEDQEPDR